MEEGKILIVDDEEDIREILEFNLENAGYSVDCAASAEEALEILSPEHRLILLDVMMEGMSGFKMAEVVRKERGSQVPIIFLTAKNAENDLLTGFSAGGDDYISKPFSIHEVIARVKAVLRRTSSDHEPVSDTIVSGKTVCWHRMRAGYIPGKTLSTNFGKTPHMCLTGRWMSISQE